MRPFRPGRDPHARRHRALAGAARVHDRTPPRVVVIGGGIAGLSAALGLAERGVAVELIERDTRFGGRVASWDLAEGRTMSRGFHAFFRQYYNLRRVLQRIDPTLSRLIPVSDYPLQRADGLRDSFTAVPRTPPWNLLGFVARSPSFTVPDLTRIDLGAALELIATDFPASFADHDGESAAQFLDRLRFPANARHLALEVFSRSFFAHPEEFSAAEMVAMFHTYFTGSAEGLLFDVPNDHYQAALWGPLVEYLHRLGVQCHPDQQVNRIELGADDRVTVRTAEQHWESEAVVLAADPASSRDLVASLDMPSGGATAAMRPWQQQVAAQRNAPPFAVWRLWLDRPVHIDRPAFLGTTGYGPLDNVSVLERFEGSAATWAARHGGSVVELHAYALDRVEGDQLRTALRSALSAVYAETASARVLRQEWLVRDDCPLIPPGAWRERPPVTTPDHRLLLAGDWVRTDHPVALMERAATTGLQAANQLLAGWGLAGHDLWTVNPRGLVPRRLMRRQLVGARDRLRARGGAAAPIPRG